MNTDWLVVASGAAAALWLNWYFFLAARGTGDVARGAHPRAPVQHGNAPRPAGGRTTATSSDAPERIVI
ncbi:MAG: hypothetical protein JWN53_68, partial [Gemmatimonadetes bacterium]|nr:hypothetical protein [Gemmatimonadota bacterium]